MCVENVVSDALAQPGNTGEKEQFDDDAEVELGPGVENLRGGPPVSDEEPDCHQQERDVDCLQEDDDGVKIKKLRAHKECEPRTKKGFTFIKENILGLQPDVRLI